MGHEASSVCSCSPDRACFAPRVLVELEELRDNFSIYQEKGSSHEMKPPTSKGGKLFDVSRKFQTVPCKTAENRNGFAKA